MGRAGLAMAVMSRAGYLFIALASIIAAKTLVGAHLALGVPLAISMGGLVLASLCLIKVCQILRPDQSVWGRLHIQQFAAFMLAIVAVQLICHVARVALGDDDAGAQMVREIVTATAFGALIAAPLFEEVVFRGLLWRAMEFGKGRVAIAIAVIVTAGAFALAHGQSNPAQLALMGAAGIILGVARAVSGGVALPIALHIAMNLYVAAGAF